MNDDTNQRAREKAAQFFGFPEWKYAETSTAKHSVQLLADLIARNATSAREEALREAAEKIDALERLWTRVSDQLDYIPDGMHAGLEDAASDMANAFDALITGGGEREE